MSAPDRAPVVTLLTDYGLADAFVGVLHGVIAGICPQARVIDISHGVARHDIYGGAVTLAQAIPYMPAGVHVAIVDPAVGSERLAVAVQAGEQRTFVGPDNGLLWPAVAASGGPLRAFELSRSPWRLEPVSVTFHGRDIFAAVAAHLAAGEDLGLAGEEVDVTALVRLDMPAPLLKDGALVAAVNSVDGFGNVQLAAARAELAALGVRPGDQVRIGLGSGGFQLATSAASFDAVAEGELVVLEDSAQLLAIAVNRGSAAARLGLRAPDLVRLSLVPAGR